MILVTGFLPYRDEQNASGELITSLKKDTPEELAEIRDDIVFKRIEIKKNSRANELINLTNQLSGLLEKYKPTICIFTGQAPSSNNITIEKVGLNSFMEEVINPDSPVAYWSNLPGTEKIKESLNNHNIPAAYSYYAGQSLCNLILYSCLHHCEIKGLDIKAGFIHLPLLPEQLVNKYEDYPCMTLDMTRKALSIIINQVYKEECADQGVI